MEYPSPTVSTRPVGFVSPSRTGVKRAELAAASDPRLPSVERKIEKADEYACKRQNRCGNVGIDKLIHIVEQKPALVWLHASLGFEPVLKHS